MFPRLREQIGTALRDKPSYHVVVVRSTVLPGTTHAVVIPALERHSGKKYGDGFGVSVNPEFLREGTALKDFRKPPLTLVGHNHAADASGTIALYQAIDAPLVSTSIRVAEMIKYTSNAWHALKVCFANEIGTLCKRLDIDSHEVMDVFCRDEKQGTRRRSAGDLVHPAEQPAADSARLRSDHGDRLPAHRPARLQLQGRYRRSS